MPRTVRRYREIVKSDLLPGMKRGPDKNQARGDWGASVIEGAGSLSECGAVFPVGEDGLSAVCSLSIVCGACSALKGVGGSGFC